MLPTIIVLVGLTAFGLGRLSVMGEPVLPGTQEVAVVGQPYSAKATKGLGNFVASKSGSTYYLPSCSGASRIKEENRVWFATVAEARAAGYTAAANCPGL